MIDQEGLRAMKERGTYCVPTLYVIDYLTLPDNPMRPDPSIVAKAERMRGFQRDRFAEIVRHGVPVAYGTDIGVFPHGENWRDFPCMVECGMSPLDAIRTATIHSAKMNGIDDLVGALSEGKRADVIAVSGDPLEDVGRLANPVFVMRDGAVVRHEAR
jgi:imidazolonepropionase-like amidohydrolase